MHPVVLVEGQVHHADSALIQIALFASKDVSDCWQ
jgi:hypothetical protein